MQTRRSSKIPPDPVTVSMEVDATGAAGGTSATANNDDDDDDDDALVSSIDAIARAASSATSESSRLAACSELAARCASSAVEPIEVLTKITSNLQWWDLSNSNNRERSEEVRLERCRALSAALLLLAKRNSSSSPLPPSSSSSPPLPPDLAQRVAQALALSLLDGFYEVVLAACRGARLLAALLVAEAASFSARERALVLDSVASSSSSNSSSSLPLPADLLVETLARATASHRRSAVREAGAHALGSLSPVVTRSSGILQEKGLPALAALAAADPFPKVRAAAVLAAGACLQRKESSSTWLARRAMPVLALALTDGDEGVAAAAAAALSLSATTTATTAAAAATAAENDNNQNEPPLRTTVSMEDAAAAAATAVLLRTTVSMTDAEELEGKESAATAAVDPSFFPFARPRALLFSIRGSLSSNYNSSSPIEETLSWLVKLALEDDNGLADNTVLSLSLVPLPAAAAAAAFFNPSSAAARRSPSLFCLDSDAAAASSARLLWGLVSLCGGDIEGNTRRERYGGRLVRSLLALLRAAAARAPPPMGFGEGEGEEAAAPSAAAAAAAASPHSLLLRSVALAAQAVGAWVPVSAWLGPATATGSGGGGGGGGEACGTSNGGEEEEGEGGGGEFDGDGDLGLRCGLLKMLLFGLEGAASRSRDPGNDRRRLLRAGGEVEAVAAVVVAAVASSSSSSSARSVLSLVSALVSASGPGELRKLDGPRRAELWLAVVASEQDEAEREQRQQQQQQRPPPEEAVSSRLAAACGFASTAALAAEHVPAVLEMICRVREGTRE